MGRGQGLWDSYGTGKRVMGHLWDGDKGHGTVKVMVMEGKPNFTKN